MSITRRQFVQRSGLLAAATALSTACSDNSDQGPGNAPTALVIGSGFAGSVAALRLGQAGISTIILERGQQWTVDGPDTFPSIFGTDRRSTWFGDTDALTGGTEVERWAGLIERVSGDTLDAVCGACVGGGSLVYGGVLIQPRREVFESVFPDISYDDMDNIYYPRVLTQIGARTIPDDILASDTYFAHRTFLADARAAGFDADRVHASFDWDIIADEIAGRIPAAASVGDYVYGCNSNAKLSTDKNYLRNATATGNVELRSLTQVMEVRQNSEGYTASCRRINPDGDILEEYELDASHVFLAAGSLNTSKLLLKSQQSGGLGATNADIGRDWGTNGDDLMLELSQRPVSGAQGGPACIAAWDSSNADYPVTFMHSPTRVPVNVQIQLAMSVPDELGELVYEASNDRVGIRWPNDENTGSAQARRDSFARLLAESGGISGAGLSGRQTIWHPLGGAVMGAACDHLGQLYGYQNLFVIDGSLLPGSAGAANPALTIAANAERIMEQLIPGIKTG